MLGLGILGPLPPPPPPHPSPPPPSHHPPHPAPTPPAHPPPLPLSSEALLPLLLLLLRLLLFLLSSSSSPFFPMAPRKIQDGDRQYQSCVHEGPPTEHQEAASCSDQDACRPLLSSSPSPPLHHLFLFLFPLLLLGSSSTPLLPPPASLRLLSLVRSLLARLSCMLFLHPLPCGGDEPAAAAPAAGGEPAPSTPNAKKSKQATSPEPVASDSKNDYKEKDEWTPLAGPPSSDWGLRR
eukprot:4628975-Pyramimonas_sp.AAC.2